MSTALAIASVTYLLKDLLNDGLINSDVTAVAGQKLEVSALPPDRIDLVKTDAESRLNLYMYHTTPNQGWRNSGLPSSDRTGERIGNPPLALDLHYLLTAYGPDEVFSQIVLGYGMQLLHETPVLPRDAIRRWLNVKVEAGGLPDSLKSLADSELAGQIEQIKIVPQTMSTEEMSKLWTAFQAKYRPTAAYLVSAVLIESKKAAKSPLPVLTRGKPDAATGRDEGIKSRPSLLPPYPTLTRISFQNSQLSARLGETLIIEGHNLDADTLAVRCASSLLDKPVEAIVAKKETSAVTVSIPDAPADWPVGVYTLSILVKKNGEDDRNTNSLPFVLSPTLLLAPAASRDGDRKVTVTVKCKPEVRPLQKVSLVIGEREFWAETHTGQTDTLSFKIGEFPSGRFYCRLRIDGAESILIDRTKIPMSFDSSQQVSIP